jgi:hypothetical protein
MKVMKVMKVAKPRPKCWICNGRGKITIDSGGSERSFDCVCIVMTQDELVTFDNFCKRVNDAWADLPDEIRAKFHAVVRSG